MMIRRITALSFGAVLALSAGSAFADDHEGGGEEAGGEESSGAAAASTSGEASASVEGLPDSKGDFGKSGQIAISSDFELSLESRSSKPPQGDAGDSRLTIAIAPALDYFVTDGVSVGGQIAFWRASQGDDSMQMIGIGPRVGYNLGLTETISLWPKVGVRYAMLSTKADVGGTTVESDGSKLTLQAHVPLLIHPAKHFFIGIGPTFEMDLMSKVEDNDGNKDTAFGLASVVGGWF
ncbi:MAG: hypothetical protein KF718_24340 [Polyangiaceae bacterium]|nr:hypothetical protein [Polyangiaceae bacterium]